MSVSVLKVIVPADSSAASAVCAWCGMGISLTAGHVLVGTDNTNKNLHEEPCYRNCTNYNAMVQRINKLDRVEIDELIAVGLCPFEPEHMSPMPIGMFHCALCGEMVVAGLPHGRDPDYPKCGWCEEDVFPWEEDDKFPEIKDGATGKKLHFHVECHCRFALGSKDHMMKVCTCYGGVDDGEEGLTKREAAQLAYEYFQEGAR